MIYLEGTYNDWEGSVLLRIVYSSNSQVNTEKKRRGNISKVSKDA